MLLELKLKLPPRHLHAKRHTSLASVSLTAEAPLLPSKRDVSCRLVVHNAYWCQSTMPCNSLVDAFAQLAGAKVDIEPREVDVHPVTF